MADQPHPGHTYFRSRLAFSPDGRHLLVNGWYWQPEAIVEVHDVAVAMADPRSLDVNLLRDGAGDWTWRGEVVSACWLDSDRIALLETEDGGDEGEFAGSDTLAVLGVDGTAHARNRVGVTPGLLVPCDGLVLNLHTHPSLLDPATGRTLRTWPELDAGDASLCYGGWVSRYPVFAYDAGARRLTLEQADHVAVIELSSPGW